MSGRRPISALVEAHVASDFDVASDMLTRTSRTSDVAPDVSVFPRTRDQVDVNDHDAKDRVVTDEDL